MSLQSLLSNIFNATFDVNDFFKIDIMNTMEGKDSMPYLIWDSFYHILRVGRQSHCVSRAQHYSVIHRRYKSTKRHREFSRKYSFQRTKDKTSLQENIYSLLKDYEWRLRGSDVKTAGKVHLSEHSIKMQLDVETSHCYIFKPLISNMAKNSILWMTGPQCAAIVP